MKSLFFNPSVMLLSGGIDSKPSGQSYIGNDDTTSTETNPYSNTVPFEENKNMANVAIEEPATTTTTATEPAQTSETPAESAASE